MLQPLIYHYRQPHPSCLFPVATATSAAALRKRQFWWIPAQPNHCVYSPSNLFIAPPPLPLFVRPTDRIHQIPARISLYLSLVSRWRTLYVQIHNLPLLAAAHLSHNRFRHTHVGIAAAGCSKKVTLGQELLRRRIYVNYANCSFLPITHSLTHHGSPAVTTTLGAAYKIFISRIMRELKQVEKWCIPSECI